MQFFWEKAAPSDDAIDGDDEMRRDPPPLRSAAVNCHGLGVESANRRLRRRRIPDGGPQAGEHAGGPAVGPLPPAPLTFWSHLENPNPPQNQIYDLSISLIPIYQEILEELGDRGCLKCGSVWDFSSHWSKNFTFFLLKKWTFYFWVLFSFKFCWRSVSLHPWPGVFPKKHTSFLS